MAKAGDKVTDSQGQTWVATQGGNYRLYTNGKPTSTISKTDPSAGAAPGAAPGGGPNSATSPQTVNNNTPQNLSPSGQSYLAKSQSDLQAQVASGAINQAQANQELAKQTQKIQGLSPALQDSAWQLEGQNIPQTAKDAELYRQQTLENQTQPNTGNNLTANSSTSDVQNQIADSAKGYTQAGNLLTNPNQTNQFGSSNVTIGPDGQPQVTQQLSAPNQAGLSNIQGTAADASSVAQGALSGGQYQSFLNGAAPQSGPSQQLQDAIYGHLTQGFDAQKKQDYEDFSQQMANRGIPIGSDAYKNAKTQLDTSWQQKEGDAQDQAVSGAYGQATTQQNANTSSLNAATSGINSLSNVGASGYQNPNFQNFSSVAYQQPDTQGLYNTQVASNLSQAQIQAQIQEAQIQAAASKANAATAAGASTANAATGANATITGDTILAGTKPQPSGFASGA